MSGTIPPLPQYAFMTWCSVKAQGQLYLYLYWMGTIIRPKLVIYWRNFVDDYDDDDDDDDSSSSGSSSD
jgi:hypothetical protein